MSLDEFKGRVPIRRGSLSIEVGSHDFDNPLAHQHIETRTGGSRSTGTRLFLDLALLERDAGFAHLQMDMFGLYGRTLFVWCSAAPALSGMGEVLRCAKLGVEPQRWFAQSVPSLLDRSWRHALLTRYVVLAGRANGSRIPAPEKLSLDQAWVAAEALADAKRRGEQPVLRANSSTAVRVCLAAEERGLDISGTTMRVSAEPFTRGKAAVVHRVGCTAASWYGAGEAGIISLPCSNPGEVDEVHLMADKLAMIQREREIAPGRSVLVNVYSSLVPSVSGSYHAADNASAALVLELLSARSRSEYRCWTRGNPTLPMGVSSAGCRPLAVPIVFAGALRNRDELAAEFGRTVGEGVTADCELLWRLYRRYGPEGFERINGAFALALFDAEMQELVLAVDRWTAQPLYYCSDANGWLFAGEQKTLLASRTGQLDMDIDTATHLQQTKYLPVHRTLFADVATLGPGEYARIGKDGVQVKSYVPLHLQIDAAVTEEHSAAELREHLLAATRRLVQGQARIGVALSGGLDSVVTVGAVRAVAPEVALYTYTAGFNRNDPVFAKAAAVAEHYRTSHREILIEPEELPAALPQLIWRMEDPVAREEMLVYDRLTQRAAQEVPIVLYGHMADMLFAGMPRHRLIRTAASVRWGRTALMEFYDYTQTGAEPDTLEGKLLVALYFRRRLAQPLSSVHHPSTPSAKRLQIAREQPLNNALLTALAEPSELPAMQRLHTAAGLCMGSIFHDREVANYAFQIPDHLKIRGRSYKHILRVAAAQLVPEQFARRPKDLIRIGLSARARRVMQAMADELLTLETVRARGIFCRERCGGA